jgi:hypothetical protein
MAYALSIGSLLVTNGPTHVKEECTCQEARHGCTPAFVFSVPGQIGFRSALNHLTDCRRSECRSLRANVLDGMLDKLRWLMNENKLLGCVHIQAELYGSRKVTLQRNAFPAIAHHLARCPKDSCAQLRRAVLLTIRDSIRADQ